MGFGREAYRRGIESIGAERVGDGDVSDEELLRRRDELMKERAEREEIEAHDKATAMPYWAVVIFNPKTKTVSYSSQERFFPTLKDADLWYGEMTLNPGQIDYAAVWDLLEGSIENEYRSPTYTKTPSPPGTDVVVRSSPDEESAEDGDDGPSGAMLAMGAGLVLGGLVLGSQGKKGKGKGRKL